jgi:flagellar motor switch protein FliN/FliY
MTAQQQVAHFSDVPIDVEVELDRRFMTVREILALESGHVVKMVRSAGENMAILMGGALVGSGEIVIADETVAVRITDFRQED